MVAVEEARPTDEAATEAEGANARVGVEAADWTRRDWPEPRAIGVAAAAAATVVLPFDTAADAWLVSMRDVDAGASAGDGGGSGEAGTRRERSSSVCLRMVAILDACD